MDEMVCEHGYIVLVCDGELWFPSPCPTCEPLTDAGSAQVTDLKNLSSASAA
jgi:hypothetical protein